MKKTFAALILLSLSTNCHPRKDATSNLNTTPYQWQEHQWQEPFKLTSDEIRIVDDMIDRLNPPEQRFFVQGAGNCVLKDIKVQMIESDYTTEPTQWQARVPARGGFYPYFDLNDRDAHAMVAIFDRLDVRRIKIGNFKWRASAEFGRSTCDERPGTEFFVDYVRGQVSQ